MQVDQRKSRTKKQPKAFALESHTTPAPTPHTHTHTHTHLIHLIEQLFDVAHALVSDGQNVLQCFGGSAFGLE